MAELDTNHTQRKTGRPSINEPGKLSPERNLELVARSVHITVILDFHLTSSKVEHPLDLKPHFKQTSHPNMTRTQKKNDRDHAGLASGTAAPEEHLPRYFAKAGHSGENPGNTKKQGGGKGNWGREGVSELEDYNYNMSKTRRRTNSSTQAAGHSGLKTKFEAIDPEAVIEYEEDIHGPSTEDLAQHDLEKMSTSSSADTMGSVEDEEAAKKE